MVTPIADIREQIVRDPIGGTKALSEYLKTRPEWAGKRNEVDLKRADLEHIQHDLDLFGPNNDDKAAKSRVVYFLLRICLELEQPRQYIAQGRDSPPPTGQSSLWFVKARGEAHVYAITPDRTRCWIPDEDTLKSLGSWQQVETLASFTELKLFPPARPIPSIIHGERPWLVRIRDEDNTYLIDEEGIRHYIPNGPTRDALVGGPDGVNLLVDREELKRFPPGDPWPSIDLLNFQYG